MLCGLCLPHCPTYRVTQDENESPRGRISLMRAAASGALPLTETLAAHLSRCLGCRACERVCPSGVRYGQLIEAGRALSSRARPPGALARLGLRVIQHSRRLRAVGSALRAYQRSGLQRLARASGLLRRLHLQAMEAQLPPLPAAQALQSRYPAQGAQRGRVALFTGCVAQVVDADTLAAAIRLLTAFGYEVLVPDGQTCCGALHREAGDTTGAQQLRNRNAAAFRLPAVEAIISLASGCGIALAEDRNDSDGLTAPVLDIHQFLDGKPLPATYRLAALAQTVIVHDPCSLRNGLRAEQSVYRLLARIPEVRLQPLPENHLCCGGAGAYALREPAMAGILRDAKLQQLAPLQPQILVSANIGCALHLNAGLRERGINLPVLHPAVVFERQLRTL